MLLPASLPTATPHTPHLAAPPRACGTLSGYRSCALRLHDAPRRLLEGLKRRALRQHAHERLPALVANVVEAKAECPTPPTARSSPPRPAGTVLTASAGNGSAPASLKPRHVTHLTV